MAKCTECKHLYCPFWLPPCDMCFQTEDRPNFEPGEPVDEEDEDDRPYFRAKPAVYKAKCTECKHFDCLFWAPPCDMCFPIPEHPSFEPGEPADEEDEDEDG